MTVWDLRGTEEQQQLVRAALDACSFPFEELAGSLRLEGKPAITVEWEDLSRYTHTEETHDHADGADPLQRQVDGRARVLGLFYLPPHTRIVLDTFLVSRPDLAAEVFIAEAAHAVDYHFMDNGMRAAVWDALHPEHEDLPAGATVHESGDLGHGHSWFDGPAGYDTWVGEAWMGLFTQAFAPSIPVTIELAHGIEDPAEIQRIREALVPPPAPADDDQLRAALARFLRTRSVPQYVREPAAAWLAAGG